MRGTLALLNDIDTPSSDVNVRTANDRTLEPPFAPGEGPWS